jgi:hypothetical protein
MGRVITREMGLTHKDFFRTIPKVFNDRAFQITDVTVTVCEAERCLRICLGPQRERRIAMLRLPVTDVSLHFIGYTETEVNGFMNRFARYFQRGGG